jgi:hypothetical protein
MMYCLYSKERIISLIILLKSMLSVPREFDLNFYRVYKKNRNLGDCFMFFRTEIFFKNDPIRVNFMQGIGCALISLNQSQGSIFKIWECVQSIPRIKLALIRSFLKKILGRKNMKKLSKFRFFLNKPCTTIFNFKGT